MNKNTIPTTTVKRAEIFYLGKIVGFCCPTLGSVGFLVVVVVTIALLTMNFNVSKAGMHKLRFVTLQFPSYRINIKL